MALSQKLSARLSQKLILTPSLQQAIKLLPMTTIELAELLTQVVPSLEMVRMVNSGTEACMTALRLARGATGRDVIIKFNGCYHGHSDSLLVARLRRCDLWHLRLSGSS